ncbi:hypothetical protein L1049_009811 [Liquidambar formosana]|uniref:F-box domain-containing protein n=1 Tax=Liquidambar formosana TaxID=63359 RepID=A0AAP0N7Y9_LIQFO
MESFVMTRHQIRMCEGSRVRKRSRRVVKWDEMPYDILVNIIQRLSWKDLALHVCCVSHSWLSALLDTLCPPGNVLDLRPIDSLVDPYYRERFRHYLKLMLDCRHTTIWTKLYLAKTCFKTEALTCIAQRLPLLHYLIAPSELALDYPRLLRLIPYWKNLRGVHGCSLLVWELKTHCKSICELSLYGRIDDHTASVISKSFPRLKYLVIRTCKLSVDALPIILDGHKNLLQLDARHCGPINEYDIIGRKFFLAPREKEWKEEVINQKDAGIMFYLECTRYQCTKCSYLF